MAFYLSSLRILALSTSISIITVHKDAQHNYTNRIGSQITATQHNIIKRNSHEMVQHVLYIFINYRGRHIKGVAIYNAT
jgi:hypothetical protein